MLRPSSIQSAIPHTSGYVCTQCRHQLALAAQRRYASSDSLVRNYSEPRRRTLKHEINHDVNKRKNSKVRARARTQADQSRQYGGVTGEKSTTFADSSSQSEPSGAAGLRPTKQRKSGESGAGEQGQDGGHIAGKPSGEEETRRRFEALMRDLESNSVDRTKQGAANQKISSSQMAGKSLDEAEERSSGVKGATSSKSANSQAQAADTPSSATSDIKQLDVPRFSINTGRARRSLLSQQLSKRRNAPEWGGSRETGQKSVKASYDTLRQADQKSPIPVVKTAGQQKGWGLEETRLDDPSERRPAASAKPKQKRKAERAQEDDDDGFQSSPAYLFESEVPKSAESQPTVKATKHTNAEALTPKKTWLGAYFDKSMSLLGLRGNLDERLDTSQPGTAIGHEAGNHTQSEPWQANKAESHAAADEVTSTLEAHKAQAKSSDDSTAVSEGTTETSATSEVLQGDDTHRPTVRRLDTEPRSARENGRLAHSVARMRALREHQISKGLEMEPPTPQLHPKSVGTAEESAPSSALQESKAADVPVSANLRDEEGSNAPPVETSKTSSSQGMKPRDALKVVKGISSGGRTPRRVAGLPKKAVIPAVKQPAKVPTPRRKRKDVATVTKSEDVATDDPSVSVSPPEPAHDTAPLASEINSIEPMALSITALNVPQPPVPSLQYGLDRVLFNQGVYQLQDAHSRVYNFDPYLQTIMPVAEFDFNALKQYKTSSQDKTLSALAKEHGKKYVGSTSSMTSTLAHFHYLLSNFREINLGMLSRQFPYTRADFTNINRAPNATFLRYKPETKTYAIDADKEYDGANVLMMLGKSMEKLLTVPKEDFERYRKTSADEDKITPQEKDEPESFEYTSMGDFLMRSQLDAYDPRLPGTGMFDLKTRAVVSVRMDTAAFQDMHGYEIHTLQGRYESYEREYYDMLRSTMLKYMLQARMGRMDGIFVAYHNVQRIFGFQYLPLSEIDRAMHGQVDPTLGDSEFKASLKLMNEVLEMATAKFPEQSLRLHFEAATEKGDKENSMMWIFAEPMQDAEIDRIQESGKAKIQEYERTMMGMETPPPTEGRQGTRAAANESVTTSHDDAGTKEEHSAKVAPATSASATSTVSRSEDYHRPLFAARIIVMNKVNGVPCEGNRPLRLVSKDKWEMEYLIREASDLDPAMKWARYEDCKTKRRELFKKYDEDDTDEVTTADGLPSGKPTAKETRESSSYLRFLRDLSAKGREFRGKIDELEKGREKVIVGWPGPLGVDASSKNKAADVTSDGDDATAEAKEGRETQAGVQETTDASTKDGAESSAILEQGQGPLYRQEKSKI